MSEEEFAHTRNSQLSAWLSGPKVVCDGLSGVGSKKLTANATVKSYPRWRSLPSDSEQGFIFDHSTETFPGRARLSQRRWPPSPSSCRHQTPA